MAILLSCLCSGLFFGCQKTADAPAAPESKPGKHAAAAKPSVSTPPLDMAQVTDTDGAPPDTPSAEKKPAATSPNSATPTAPPVTNEPTGEVIPFTPTQVKAKTNIVLLLDASGSMNGPIESGTKIGYLRSLVKELLVQPAPGTMRRSFAIRAFGTKSPVEQNNCEDSDSLATFDQMNPATIAPLLDGITPRGTSPLAYALQQAAAMLPDANQDADNMIIVLADGGDSCQADPCLAAEQIHSGPKKALISAIGFDLDQSGEQQLRCMAEHSDGRFFLARSVPELRTAADQAINANLPYNLRIKTFAGTVPINTKITVYRSGTQQVIDDGNAPGVKFFQLQPGSYDIQVTYAESPELSKPAKLLKGVEVQSTARAEQVVRFDLGTLELSGIAPDGSQVELHYTLRSGNSPDATATITGGSAATSALLRPGTYSIDASGPTINGVPLRSSVDKVTITAGQSISQLFQFETGTLFLRAQTSRGIFIPATYRIATIDKPDAVLTTGTSSPDGSAIPLPVGTYRVTVASEDPLIAGQEPIVFDSVVVPARDQIQQLAVFPVGTLQLLGKDAAANPTKTAFTIRTDPAGPPLTQVQSTTAPASLDIRPGKYHVTAVNQASTITPAPTIQWDAMEVTADAVTARDAQFQLGSITITGVDARNAPIAAEYALFQAGDETPIDTRSTDNGITTYQLTPGLYDIRAQDTSSRGTVKPTLWLRSIPVAPGSATDRHMIFTAGRVRLTCRAANDIPIGCTFRVFTYGQDAPLVAGDTRELWQEFEMKPGYYYLEVGYFDPTDDQVLKKWINISVDENQTVEQIVRF